MDRLQAEAAIGRALELEAAEADRELFDRAALERLGEELGVSIEALNRAIDEILTAPAGPLNAAAARTVDAPRSEVESALESMLRLRGLTTNGGDVWQQDTGWWPDLFRFRSVTTLAVTMVGAGVGTTVRFMARLDRIWRAHLAAAVVVPLLLAAAAVTNPVSLVAMTLGWMALCGGGYLYRREAVRRRLEQGLSELSQPRYRRQPW